MGARSSMTGGKDRKIIVFGAGQIAEVVHFYLGHDSRYEVAAFVVDAQFLKASTLRGLPVVALEEVHTAFPPAAFDAFVAMSFRGLNAPRAAKAAEMEGKGYRLATYLSSKATAWQGLELAPNTFVMEQNVIQPYARIGGNTIVWSGNHIGHHSTIGENCFIASHAVISGAVTIGDFSFVGVNATIRDNISIGKRCVIGAGALILKDAKDGEVYMGSGSEASRVPSHRLPNI